MTKFFISPLLIISIFANYLFAQKTDGWVFKKEKDGVKIYTRDVQGSKIKELKFSTTVNASLSAVCAVLSNVEGFDDWVYASVKSEMIKKVSETEFYYYAEVDFPWPLTNRDLVLHTTLWQDPKNLSIQTRTTSVHWMQGEKDDLVRIKMADLRWSFTPLGNNKVQVEYYLKSDPGGSLPAWMVNLGADQGPVLTMEKFKEMLKKDAYKNARLAYVQEKK